MNNSHFFSPIKTGFVWTVKKTFATTKKESIYRYSKRLRAFTESVNFWYANDGRGKVRGNNYKKNTALIYECNPPISLSLWYQSLHLIASEWSRMTKLSWYSRRCKATWIFLAIYQWGTPVSSQCLVKILYCSQVVHSCSFQEKGRPSMHAEIFYKLCKFIGTLILNSTVDSIPYKRSNITNLFSLSFHTTLK